MMRAAAALLIVASGVAEAAPKQVWLDAKAGGRAVRAAAHARETAAVRARIGAPAETPLTIRNQWTHEVLVVAPPTAIAPGGVRLPPPPPRGRRRRAAPPPGPPPVIQAAALPAATVAPFLRCRFTDRKTAIDARLLPVVIQAATDFNSPYIEIVSGYRSPKYNLMLRKKGHQVADDSQHSHGHAVDFRIAGVPTTVLRDWVKSLKLGGVGFYPESAFVHADVGPIRFWTGK